MDTTYKYNQLDENLKITAFRETYADYKKLETLFASTNFTYLNAKNESEAIASKKEYIKLSLPGLDIFQYAEVPKGIKEQAQALNIKTPVGLLCSIELETRIKSLADLTNISYRSYKSGDDTIFKQLPEYAAKSDYLNYIEKAGPSDFYDEGLTSEIISDIKKDKLADTCFYYCGNNPSISKSIWDEISEQINSTGSSDTLSVISGYDPESAEHIDYEKLYKVPLTVLDSSLLINISKPAYKSLFEADNETKIGIIVSEISKLPGTLSEKTSMYLDTLPEHKVLINKNIELALELTIEKAKETISRLTDEKSELLLKEHSDEKKTALYDLEKDIGLQQDTVATSQYYKDHISNINNKDLKLEYIQYLKKNVSNLSSLDKLINFVDTKVYSDVIATYDREQKEKNAKSEAIKEDKTTINNNKMENQEKKTENKVTYEGYISALSEPKKFDSGKQVINMSVAMTKEGQEIPEYKDVQLWFDEKNPAPALEKLPFKKGDTVKVTGYENTYKDKTYMAASLSSVVKQQKGNAITIKGNLATDVTSKDHDNNKMYKLVIAVNEEGKDTRFIHVQAWEKDQQGEKNKGLYAIETGKKGDYVEVSGNYSKEYTYKDKNEQEQVGQALVIKEYKSISTTLARSADQEQKNEFLKKAAQNGNYKEVEVALKAGADIDVAKKVDLSMISEKQRNAVTDIIAKQEAFQKKNPNSIKM